MSRPTLIIFARVPAVGVGKSRLAAEVGRVEAWRVYRAMRARLLRRLKDPRWRLVVRVTPDRAARPGEEGQGGGDLGARLQRALRAHARCGVAVVGTDSPEITRAEVAAALVAARRSGAAIGPAEDGGFWILALAPRAARAVRLDGVRWSTAHACADVEAALGGRVVRLGLKADVDDAEGLRAWRRRAPRASA